MSKQTGLDFMRTATAEEIAKVLATGHPPTGEVHCCLLYTSPSPRDA